MLRFAILVLCRLAAVVNFFFGLLGLSLAGAGDDLTLEHGWILPMFVLGVIPLRIKWPLRGRLLLLSLAVLGLTCISVAARGRTSLDFPTWWALLQTGVLVVLGFAHAIPRWFTEPEDLCDEAV